MADELTDKELELFAEINDRYGFLSMSHTERLLTEVSRLRAVVSGGKRVWAHRNKNYGEDVVRFATIECKASWQSGDKIDYGDYGSDIRVEFLGGTLPEPGTRFPCRMVVIPDPVPPAEEPPETFHESLCHRTDVKCDAFLCLPECNPSHYELKRFKD